MNRGNVRIRTTRTTPHSLSRTIRTKLATIAIN
jgi:hypothetical protein